MAMGTGGPVCTLFEDKNQYVGTPSPDELCDVCHAHSGVVLVEQWIHHEVCRMSLFQKNLVESPIVSRVIQEISNGMLAYQKAMVIATVPFPFPFAQVLTIALLMFVVVCPWFAMEITKENEAPQWASLMLTFFTTAGYAALNEIAVELEEPFGVDDNDFPVHIMQWSFVSGLEDIHFAVAPTDFLLDTYGQLALRSKQIAIERAEENYKSIVSEALLSGGDIPKPHEGSRGVLRKRLTADLEFRRGQEGAKLLGIRESTGATDRDSRSAFAQLLSPACTTLTLPATLTPLSEVSHSIEELRMALDKAAQELSRIAERRKTSAFSVHGRLQKLSLAPRIQHALAKEGVVLPKALELKVAAFSPPSKQADWPAPPSKLPIPWTEDPAGEPATRSSPSSPIAKKTRSGRAGRLLHLEKPPPVPPPPASLPGVHSEDGYSMFGEGSTAEHIAAPEGPPDLLPLLGSSVQQPLRLLPPVPDVPTALHTEPANSPVILNVNEDDDYSDGYRLMECSLREGSENRFIVSPGATEQEGDRCLQQSPAHLSAPSRELPMTPNLAPGVFPHATDPSESASNLSNANAAHDAQQFEFLQQSGADKSPLQSVSVCSSVEGGDWGISGGVWQSFTQDTLSPMSPAPILSQHAMQGEAPSPEAPPPQNAPLQHAPMSGVLTEFPSEAQSSQLPPGDDRVCQSLDNSHQSSDTRAVDPSAISSSHATTMLSPAHKRDEGMPPCGEERSVAQLMTASTLLQCENRCAADLEIGSPMWTPSITMSLPASPSSLLSPPPRPESRTEAPAIESSSSYGASKRQAETLTSGEPHAEPTTEPAAIPSALAPVESSVEPPLPPAQPSAEFPAYPPAEPPAQLMAEPSSDEFKMSGGEKSPLPAFSFILQDSHSWHGDFERLVHDHMSEAGISEEAFNIEHLSVTDARGVEFYDDSPEVEAVQFPLYVRYGDEQQEQEAAHIVHQGSAATPHTTVLPSVSWKCPQPSSVDACISLPGSLADLPPSQIAKPPRPSSATVPKPPRSWWTHSLSDTRVLSDELDTPRVPTAPSSYYGRRPDGTMHTQLPAALFSRPSSAGRYR